MGDQFFEVFRPKGPREASGAAAPGGPAPEPSPPEPRPSAGDMERDLRGIRVRDIQPGPLAPPRPARPGDEKAIVLRFEEIVVFLVGGMMLMVIAFLLGWYGHKRSAGATVLPVREAAEVPRIEEPITQVGSVPATRVEPRGATPRVDGGAGGAATAPAAGTAAAGTGSGGATAAGAGVEKVWSLEVIRYPRGDSSAARAVKENLEAKGYAPVFILPSNREVGVFAGRFASKDDPRIEKWAKDIRALKSAYRWCEVKQVQ